MWRAGLIMKKYIAFIFILLSALSVAGCNREKNISDSVKQAPVIVIGSDSFEPYIYLNDNGEFEGIDVELATQAFHRMGYEPEFKLIVWENKKDYLEDGEIDCLWGCFSMDGREDEYQWAGPYLYSRQSVAVRMDSNIWEIADLKDRVVAVQETSKAEEYFLHSTGNVPDVRKVYCFSGMDEVFAALRKNYVDAICGHESALLSFIDTAPDEYRLLADSLFSTKLGVAFADEYDSGFVSLLEETLSGMLSDGTTEEIVEKYGLDAKRYLRRGE